MTMEKTETALEPLELTREAILAGSVQRIAALVKGLVVLSEAELGASLAHTLVRRPATADVWVFGYGSLIWNPAFTYAERCLGRVHGWHRRLCLWTQLGRGSPEHPGLTLALDRGGSCGGVAYRIPRDQAETELGILWRREMVSGSYVPRWVDVRTATGTVPAIAFTINRQHPRYTGKLDDETIVRTVASAVGRIGPCADYVFKTVAALKTLGIRDARIEEINDRVVTLQARG
jgi:cation transport protein ChaC